MKKRINVKSLIIAIVSVLLIAAIISLIVVLARPKETCVEHKFDKNNICEICGAKEEDVSYSLDIISVDCAIKVFVGDEKKLETFGMGTNLTNIPKLYDNNKVLFTAAFSDETKVEVYRCDYVKDGKYKGYANPSDSAKPFLADKTYNKEHVYTLSVTSPIFEMQSDTDCLYIFEIKK